MHTLKAMYNSCVVGVSAGLAYLGLEKDPMMILAILLSIDYATGLVKAYTVGHSITSHKMKYGIASKLSLFFIPLSLALASKGMSLDADYFLIMGLNILILSELYSIIGNIYAIRKGEELPEIDAVAIIGKKIKDFLMRLAGEDKNV